MIEQPTFLPHSTKKPQSMNELHSSFSTFHPISKSCIRTALCSSTHEPGHPYEPLYARRLMNPTLCRCRFIAHTADLSALGAFTISRFIRSSTSSTLRRLNLRCLSFSSCSYCHAERSEASSSEAEMLRGVYTERSECAQHDKAAT